MITNGKMKQKFKFSSSVHDFRLTTEKLAITASCFGSFLNAAREIYLYKTEIAVWDFQKLSKGLQSIAGQQLLCFYYTNNTNHQNIPREHLFPKGIKF